MMQQESGSKRLVFSLCVDYHFVDHVKCCYGINIEVLYPGLDRGFVFRGCSKLMNLGAWVRAAREWAISSHVPRLGVVEA